MTKQEYDERLYNLKAEHQAASNEFCKSAVFNEEALKRFFAADKAIQELDREWCEEHGEKESIFAGAVMAARRRSVEGAKKIYEGMQDAD